MTEVDRPETSVLEHELGHLGYAVVEGSMTYLPAGRINDNFTVRVAGDTAVLRVWKESTEEQAVSELTVLRHLADAGVRCVRPFKDQGDAPIVVGGRPAALFEFIPGSPYTQLSRESHASMCAEVSRLLARAHGAAAGLSELPFRQRTFSERLADYTNAARALDLGESTRRVEEILEAITALADEVRTVTEEAALRFGVVHGDPGTWNVLVEDERPWLLDFDMCHRDLLAYDLAQMLSQWAAYAGEWWDARLARLMINAYSEVRPLSASERRVVALSVPLRQALDTLGALPYFFGSDAPYSFGEYLGQFDDSLATAGSEEWLQVLTE